MTTYSKIMTCVALVAVGCAAGSILHQFSMQKKMIQLDQSNKFLLALLQEETPAEADARAKREIERAAKKKTAKATKNGDATGQPEPPPPPPAMAVEKVAV